MGRGSDLKMPNLGNSSYVAVFWSPPPSGYPKVNFDVAVLTDKVAVGYIIRDCKGTLIRVGGK